MRSIDYRVRWHLTGLILCLTVGLSACTGLQIRKDETSEPGPDKAAAPQTSGNQSVQDPAVSAKYAEALAAMRVENTQKAHRLLREMSQAQPTLAGPQINLGILLLAEKDTAGAEDMFRRVLEHSPHHPIASNQLGLLLRRQGRFSEAEKAYKNALSSSPEYLLAHRNIGILYDLYLQKPEQALYHYQRYMALVDAPEKEVTAWIADLKLRVKPVATNE